MAITLSLETQELIQARMKELGYESSDEFLRAAVQTFYPTEVCDYDNLDDQTRAAIEEAEKQTSIPWESVRVEMMRKYGGK